MIQMLFKLNDIKTKDVSLDGEIDLSKTDKLTYLEPQCVGRIKYNISFKKDDDIYLLVLHICGKIYTLCQMCIKSLDYTIDEVIELPILNGETQLYDVIESHDNELYDAFTINQEINVEDFVIDEIIMSMPIAFKHEIC